MKFNEIGMGESDVLVYRSDATSIDPKPNRERHDPRIAKGMVEDHIGALRSINRMLPATAGIMSALAELEDQYGRMFGQRLNELDVPPSQHAQSAAIELRRILRDLVAKPHPDISYGAIDRIMRGICDDHGCSTKVLHDVFVDCFDKTPDQWAKDHLPSGA